MKPDEGLPSPIAGRSRRAASALTGMVAALLCAPAVVEAKDAVPNLGGGLEQVAAAAGDARVPAPAAAQRRSSLAATSEETPSEEITSPVQFDDAGRALVRISLDGNVPGAAMLQSLQASPDIGVVASDLNYRAGVLEAWVPPTSLVDIARTKGVLAVVPTVPLITNVGLTDSQGIVQHRVDKLPAGIDGSGITVGVISDSFDTNAASNSAALDVASGDLPGTGNPLGNTEPVVVLQDSPLRTDEGRAMAQIVHDLAPKARLGFATANGGQVNLANNIRALAALPGAANVVPGFKADVIVDDVIYPDEPFFQDGIVAQAVDEVVASGVSYFSSAGNRAATQAYDSQPRIVPPDAATIAAANLDFTAVRPDLYAGGFHDFDPGDGVDIAQTIVFTAGNTFVFQWNEPFDPKPATVVGAPFASGVGTVPPNGTAQFTFNGTAGQTIQVFVDADNTNGNPIPDLVIALIDPNGALLQTTDTGTNPEFINRLLAVTGTYTVVVDSFLPTQSGDFLYRVQNITVEEEVLTDYNLLFFRTNGTFLGFLGEQNRLTNRPLEIGGIPAGSFQLVIARSNVPSGPKRNIGDRIRYVGYGGVAPQEFFSYLDPVTYGHNSARGAMGVAAYPFFAPFVPEAFTSPGPATIYFDKDSRRLRNPDFRLKPDLAAMDGANNTFFSQDSTVDLDNFPNFFGTSAAAPHAAAIAALVLDAAGGPGKVKPDKMRKILQDSAFAHDLDPYFSWGVGLGRGELVFVNSSADPNAISQFDPNVFTLTHLGFKKMRNFSLNGSDANPTQTPKGIVFDERVLPANAPPGQPFIVGRTVGITAADVTSVFSLPADAPGVAGQWKQLDLTFGAGSFRSGDLLSFGLDRDEADAAGPVTGAAGGNSADLLGGGILIPSGQFVDGGAKFSGTFEDGSTFKGEFNNLLGNGWSPLDGYGFVNAEAAVKAVLKKH